MAKIKSNSKNTNNNNSKNIGKKSKKTNQYKEIFIDANYEDIKNIENNILQKETRVAVVNEKNELEYIEYHSSSKSLLKNNIYLATITRIEPALQAVFVDYGQDKSGFLPFNEIHDNYFESDIAPDKKSKKDFAIFNHEIKIINNVNLDIDIPNICSEYDETNSDLNISEIESLIENEKPLKFDLEVEEDNIDIIKNNDLSGDESNKESNKSTKIDYKNLSKRLSIGQTLLVQVKKEERGNKGVFLTTYISLTGKYCVLLPNTDSSNGVSRKISNGEERKRLKNIVSSMISKEDKKTVSLIIRTSGAGRSLQEIQRDYHYLVYLWNKIRSAAIESALKAPVFIHEENDILLKTIRDLLDDNVKNITVQGDLAYEEFKKLITNISPIHIKLLKKYNLKTPIFIKYKIEDQILKLYQSVVHLPSGGYIVINPTEALISIDVNSGKSVQEANVEDTALHTNLEAAKIIAKQLRLRDISGLIVIDFIDMPSLNSKQIVERAFKEALSTDKAKIQINNINNFGLLELSRQRLRPSFLELHTIICNHCHGKGIVRSLNDNTRLIIRTIESEIYSSKSSEIILYANKIVISYILNYQRELIKYIEEKYQIKIICQIDDTTASDVYSIEKVKNNKNEVVTKIIPPIVSNISDVYFQSNNKANATNVDSADSKEIKIDAQQKTKINNKNTQKQINKKSTTQVNNKKNKSNKKLKEQDKE